MSQPLPDHYRMLGVHPKATYAVIHAAYRDRARLLHPDVTGDDTGMKQLNVAWDTLRDPHRRAAYDRERLLATEQQPVIVAEVQHVSVAPDHAGPPPGRPFGPIMTYGRYQGWSLGEIAQHDPGWLRWLRRVPAGRHLARDIDAVFAELEARPLTLGGRRPLGGLARRNLRSHRDGGLSRRHGGLMHLGALHWIGPIQRFMGARRRLVQDALDGAPGKLQTMTPQPRGERSMQLVFADEDCILCVDVDGDDVHDDVIAATLLEAAGAPDAAEAERFIQGALGSQARIERR